MKNIKCCLLHKSDNWKTPKKLYDLIISKGFIDLAPYQEIVIRDTLIENWNQYNRIYLNPPFSLNNDFCNKVIEYLESNKNGFVLMLIPVRSDTKYFSNLFPYISNIVFIKGRLHFNDSKDSAPFPSMLLSLDNFHKFNYGKFINCKNLSYDELISDIEKGYI